MWSDWKRRKFHTKTTYRCFAKRHTNPNVVVPLAVHDDAIERH
jgi:hypothetical protein